MKLKSVLVALLTLLCLCIIALIIHLAMNRKPRAFDEKKYTFNSKHISIEHRIQENPANVQQIREMKETIQEINERQHLINHDNYSGLEFKHTVLVIRVHRDITYLAVFFDSIRRIVGICKSLLIFAHDYYDEDMNKAITTLRFARVMQIFYPYSNQLHPNTYPGEDSRFCHELTRCVDSRKRDPVLAQTKLFWWWVTNQVFDHIGVLKNYNGYIYFLDTQMYLTADFIITAKMLEYLQPKFCLECHFLSLGVRPPRAEMYRPRSSTLMISVWGWSNYSNLGIGFNRTTWNVIKDLKEQYCYFRDPSWENSMKHLASKTRENQFYALSIEAPRFFPTAGCGVFKNDTVCNLNSVYRDILKFIPTIRHRQPSETFSLKFDASMTKYEVEPRGQWGDARDIHLCMFFSSKGRRIYY